MAVGEVFLGAFLQVFFDRLADRRLLSFLRESGIDSVIKQWKKKLSMIQVVLNDAEEKQLTNKAVKMWLDDLQDLAYDVEDILDEYATQLAERKLMTADQPTNSFTDYFSSLMSNRQMKSEIEEITDRLEDLCEQRDCLGLKDIAGGTSTAVPRRLPTTSLQHEPAVIGRDDDKAKILEMVLQDKPSYANFHVIPIVGMGGIGKTTLAREVFNDQEVKDFDPKVWVCVSDHDHFDVQKMYKAILEEITSKSSDVETFNQLQVKLRSQVVGKKFLLVLDDVWNENYGNWEILKSLFMAGAPGSRIIVTTSNLNVVSIMTGSIESHNVNLLSEEECWSVFAKHAFENRDITKFTDVEYIRQKVASKCNGLPLAARTLGGVLRCEQRESKWKDILDSKIWEDALNSSKHDEIPKVLKLSYHHLPSHLKRCFSYCSIFPKNYKFKEKDLVLLWMTEGLIQESKYYKELEDIGGEYFQDMLSRSLFQKSSENSTYKMHELVSDLVKWAFRDTSFRLEDELRTDNQSEALRKIRHLSICHLSNKIEALHEAVNLRTILEVNCLASSIDFSNILPKFKKLRVLSVTSNPNMFLMSAPPIISLPDTIGDLKHLRYLCLSSIAITSLPESTNSLINLEVLQLRLCRLINKLPPMGNVIKLRHLDIQGVNLMEMPLGMENWKNLQTLSNFFVGKDIRSSLDVLSNLKFLRGKLYVSKLKNATTPEAILCDKEKLEELWLDWDCSNGDKECQSEVVQKNVLDILRPHKNLKKLCIKGYGATQFPVWLGDLSLSLTFLETLEIDRCEKLRYLFYDREVGTSSSSSSLMDTQHLNLKITNCSSLMSLSSTGQLPKTLEHLESLKIYNCDSLTCIVRGQLPSSLRKLSVDSCKKLKCLLDDTEDVGTASLSSCSVIYTRISQLKDLDIRSCPFLACLSSKGLSLPKLKHLKIDNCSSLSTLSLMGHLPALKKIEISLCPNLSILFLEDQQTEALENIMVSFCEKLELIAKRFHKNMALQDIDMWLCNNLKSLPQGLHNLNCLRKISINFCESLFSFPDERLPSTIREVNIISCGNLKALPNGIHTLNSLQNLTISNCPRITVPEEGLPTSLTSLTVRGPNICKPLMEWGLHKLASLKYLSIAWELYSLSLTSPSTNEVSDAESFPEEGMLPPSLTQLFICEFPKLKYLSSQAFQNLTSLQRLEISDCPHLTSFPEEGLPTSLSEVTIVHCGLLKEQCKEDKGQEWSKIAHIPGISIL